MLQRTDEWYRARLGHVTASAIHNVTATIKSGEAAARANYRAHLLAERLTNLPYEGGFVSAEMQRGTELEPDARAIYAASRRVFVESAGFVRHPSIAWLGASPDGLVGDDGLVELKCPNTATHLAYWLAGVVPTRYQEQMTCQLACTRRSWCDFVSFDPRLPEDIALFVVRFTPDAERIAAIEQAAITFLQELEEQYTLIMQKRSAL